MDMSMLVISLILFSDHIVLKCQVKKVKFYTNLGIRRGHDIVDDSRLQVNKHGPRYIVIVVRLIEEHILSILSIGCEIFEDAIW